MKKVLFSFLSFLLVTGVAIGQEDPAKAMKKAARSMGSYNLDPTNNGEKLEEAKEMIDIAAADGSVSKQTKTWQTKGDIYAAYLQKDMGQLLVNTEHQPQYGNGGDASPRSLSKSIQLSREKI